MLPILKDEKGERLTHFHTAAYTEEPRGKMTYSLPHCCLYKRAMKANYLLTPTLLPIKSSKEGEWLNNFHNVAYVKLPRVKELLTPTLLPIQKIHNGQQLIHSHTVGQESRG